MAANFDPVRKWREEYARCMLHLDFEPIPDSEFRFSTVNVIDGIRLVNSFFGPGFTVRDADLIKRGDDSFALVISRSKHIIVDKQFQHFPLGRGDAALLRICEAGRLGATSNFNYVALMVPSAEMQVRFSNADEKLWQRLPKNSEGLQLLRSYVRALETGKRVMTQNSRALVQRHLFDLAALAFEQQARLGESTLSAVAAARLTTAQAIAKAHFEDSALSIGFVANALAVSQRYLQLLFQSEETTFTSYVNDLRLDRAFELLSDTQNDKQRISDIALQVGFSDVSYFDRSFKRRFSASPSDTRAKPLSTH